MNLSFYALTAVGLPSVASDLMYLRQTLPVYALCFLDAGMSTLASSSRYSWLWCLHNFEYFESYWNSCLKLPIPLKSLEICRTEVMLACSQMYGLVSGVSYLTLLFCGQLHLSFQISRHGLGWLTDHVRFLEWKQILLLLSHCYNLSLWRLLSDSGYWRQSCWVWNPIVAFCLSSKISSVSVLFHLRCF